MLFSSISLIWYSAFNYIFYWNLIHEGREVFNRELVRYLIKLELKNWTQTLQSHSNPSSWIRKLKTCCTFNQTRDAETAQQMISSFFSQNHFPEWQQNTAGLQNSYHNNSKEFHFQKTYRPTNKTKYI